MKQLEMLALLPEYAKATAEKLLSSCAWTMPCRLGETACVMRMYAERPSDTLDVSIRLEGEEHVLSLADSESFPELHAVWASRAEVPEPVLLALVEKDCGLLLQLIENAAHRQLSVQGLSKEPAGEDALAARIVAGESTLAVFKLTSSPALVSALGVLRFIDVAHPSVRDVALSAEVEYASFALPTADVLSLAPGDSLLLPEVGQLAARIVADGRFSVADSGVAAWVDDGMMRVVRAEPMSITVGELMDASGGGRAAEPVPALETPLKLVRLGKVVATGRFGKLASQSAFLVDSVSA